MARYALARPEERDPAARRLQVPPQSSAARQVLQLAHPGLLVLRRPYDLRTKRLLSIISVDEVRRLRGFLGLTGAGGGWRVVIVDSADELNANAANALLKSLEEPPPRALFLLVTSQPSGLLPTIRSRCRRLEVAPLSPEAIGAAILDNGSIDADDDDVALAARLADGSLRRAILLLQEDGIATYRAFARFASTVGDPDVAEMHALADSVSGRTADDAYYGFLDTVRAWLGRRVRGEAEPVAEATPGQAVRAVPLARWAEVWEKVAQSSTEADDLNLDRKQVVLSILMSLARAVRM
jgi:DNA polymerase-3 subunit delta'